MWSFFAKRKKKRRDRPQYRKPELTIEQILAWADAHRARTGAWPKPESGRIPGAEETWHAVQGALQAGWRGLPGGSTIPRLLAEHRGYRNIGNLPPLSYDLILRWADAHHQRTGEWPQPDSGRIPGTEETWMAVQTDLLAGCRGLPGGSTLPRLLAEHRGYRNIGNLPPLSYNLILRWADAHHHRTGEWPQETSGEVVGAPGETWFAVDRAMRFPVRGLLGGSSLAQLLAQERGVRNRSALPPLTI